MHDVGFDRLYPQLARRSFVKPLITVHLRYNSWYVSLPSSAQQQRDISNSTASREQRTFISTVSPCPGS